MLSTHEFETTRDRTGKREPEVADNDDKMLSVRDEEDEIMDATLIPQKKPIESVESTNKDPQEDMMDATEIAHIKEMITKEPEDPSKLQDKPQGYILPFDFYKPLELDKDSHKIVAVKPSEQLEIVLKELQ